MKPIDEREKFEAWLHGEDLILARSHMSAARIHKKAEFTRLAVLSGAPRFEFDQDCRIGLLALAVNRLAVSATSADHSNELARLIGTVKRLVKSIQKERANLRRAGTWG